MKFNDLSIQEKAAVIKLGVGGGLHTLLEIRLFYDGLDGPDDPPIVLKVNNSKANFVLRLKDANRAYISDWENPHDIATHKLSWAEDDNGAVVYPNVQNVNGRLVDFSRPPYSIWAGYDNAIRTGDTVRMTPQEAELFTTHYKDYYPGFNEYKYGGPEDPPKKRFKTPEEILAEKYGIEPMVMDNVVQLIPVVTQAMKNEYANTPLGLAEQFGTIGQAEDTNAFQRKVREIRNSDNPMWFGAYFVPYLGPGMLLSNAAERAMSGQYGLGLLDTGLAFAPHLSKALKPFIRNTRKAFEFNVNPTNANSGIRTEYPWLNFRTTNLVYNMDFNINPEYTKRFVNTNIPKGLLTESPLVVNENGTINNKNLIKAYKEVYRSIHPSDRKMSLSTKYNSSGKKTTLKKHLADVTKSALNFPLPKGVSRGDFVRAALIHDIGKLRTGQELSGYRDYPRHGEESANIARFVLNNTFPEFNKPEILGAVEYHMGNASYGQHGTKDIDRYTKINFDFLRGLQAADVSRGLSYDEAASRFPLLFTYDRENPVDVNFYKGSYEDQIKNVLRPLLVRQGYDAQGIKTSNLEDRINNFAHEHRRFFRGYTGKEEAATSLDTDLATGARRGFGDREKAFLKVPDKIFDAKYITPNYQYANQLGSKVGLVELQNTPTFRLSETPTNDDLARFYNDANFQLMDITRILNSKSPVGSFQKYEEPYRLQTGRSLKTDINNYYKENIGEILDYSYEKQYFKTSENDAKQQEDTLKNLISQMKDIGGFDFQPFGNEKYGYRRPTDFSFLEDMRKVSDYVEIADNAKGLTYNLFYKENKPATIIDGIDKYRYITKVLFDDGIITDKQFKKFNNITGKYLNLNTKLDDNEFAKVKDAFHKYIYNKNTMYKIKEKHYESIYGKDKLKIKYSDDYKKWINDEQNIVKFMRDNGTVPLWDMPNFGNTIVFGYEPWDTNPVKKGSIFNSQEPLGYIIGEDKSKVLDLPISDINDFTPYNFEGKNKKPIGRARKGISRKTYKSGGLINPFSYLPIQEVRY